MADSLGMAQLQPRTLQAMLRLRLRSGNTQPVLILGKAGIGKTEQITELAKSEGIGYVEVRLLLYDVAEIKGIPYADKETKTTKVFPTDLFPRVDRDGERGILVLDEVTSCQSQLRTAVYQLLDQKRQLGEYHLPDGWMVVALGNGPEDGGNFQGMEGALLNRCACYRVQASAVDWTKWARRNDVNPAVIAFIEQNPDKLHTLTQEKWEETDGAYVFASPRAWTLAARMLQIFEQDEAMQAQMSPEDKEYFVRDIVAGYVGEETALLFGSIYALKSKMINVLDILAGKKPKFEDGFDNSLKYIVAESLGQTLQRELSEAKIISQLSKKQVEMILNTIEWTLELKDNLGRNSNDVTMQIMKSLNDIPVIADLVIGYEDITPETTPFCKDDPTLCTRVQEWFEKYLQYGLDHGEQLGFNG